MSLTNNTFKSKRYLRTKFREGKYLLSSEASDLQLESQELIKEFIKYSYGDFALGVAFRPEQTSGTQITIRPGFAWQNGIPFILKSGTDAKVVLGNVPSGVTLTELSATTVDVGGKRLVLSGLANGSYSVVVEALEELVKPSGIGAVDTYLQGVNVGEETAIKSRLIYKLHVVLTSALTSTPTYPLADPNHYVNEIVITPTGGSNFLVTSTDITQDLNGADRRIVIDNSTANIPYGSEAQEYIGGLLIDSDGNEMSITSITTTDAGATVQILLDREVNYNSSNPKAGLPIITTNVPYRLVKADHYITTTSGEPLGKYYWRLADFTFNAGALTSLSDLRAITEINSFEKDHNIALVGGGNLTWSTGTNNLTFSADLLVTLPGVAGSAIIQSSGSPINIPTNGQVIYVLLDRDATINYNTTPVVALKSAVPSNVNAYIIAERYSNRLYFPNNGSFGNGGSSSLGGGAEALPPVGSIISFYDFNALISFDSNIWQYCDGSVVSDVDSPINGQTLPDLSNRYLVGFGTEGGGDIDSATWSTTPVGSASHQINIQHSHDMNSHVHSLLNHRHDFSHQHTMNNHTHPLPSRTVGLSTSATKTGSYTAWDNGSGSFSTSHTLETRSSGSQDEGWHDHLIGGSTSSPSTNDTSGISAGGPRTGTPVNSVGGAIPNTDVPSTASTLTSLSTTQSVQPRSVRVRYLIRKK